MNITKKLVIGIISVLAIFGLLVGGKKIMKQVEYNEMEKVVYSEEAHEVYKKDLLSIDKNAVFLHKNTNTGNLMSGGGSWSPELEKMVKENKYE